MADHHFYQYLTQELDKIRTAGLYKPERVIDSPQQAIIKSGGKSVLNFCANNYLGLADHPSLVQAAQEGAARWGYGMASVRFICGTQSVHKQLEQRISQFLGKQDTILYSSCFDANGGVFEALLSAEDAVISDALNHASIIDGVRLCKAQRFRYANNDMADLEQQLIAAQNCRFRLIVTDGVFSMDGIMANLPGIVALAKQYNALVMVDDSHAVGFVGKHGGGTPEHFGVSEDIDIITGTLGKALGGASGGYVAARREVIEMLRNRSRPYLFSNTLAPMIAHASIAAIDLLTKSDNLREQLQKNSQQFRTAMSQLGFRLIPGEHPIIPVMLGEAKLAQQVAERLLEKGVYVIGFSYPVVPQGQARIRTQMSAAHKSEHIEQAVNAFAEVGRELQLIN